MDQSTAKEAARIAGTYLSGIVILIFSLPALSDGPLAIIPIIGGIIVLPPVRRQLASRWDIDIPWKTSVAIAFLALVIAIFLSAGAASDQPTAGGGDTSSPTPPATPTRTPSPIAGPSTDLLPSPNDFEAGWRSTGDTNAANATEFENIDTGTIIRFEVTVHTTISDAKDGFEARKNNVQRTYSTTAIDIGVEGYYYQVNDDLYRAHFRIENIRGRVQLDGFVLTPRTNTIGFAEKLNTTITENS